MKATTKPPGKTPGKTPRTAIDFPSGLGFGAFRGVFIPSILTILGVILYLRMGWIVGNVGLTQTLIIVTMATAITLLTGLSISATATNMKVGGGGAYYMISRSFGVEAGAAIGIPLFFAQALGISFYVAGFAEAVNSILPFLPMKAIGVVSLVLLAFLAYRSAELALKTQTVIFAIIIVSLVSFFLGGVPEGGFLHSTEIPPKASFWVVFAVFFPAVTGILAGVSMSGDLKNPARALPIGTLTAILVGYIVYCIVPIYLAKIVPVDVLQTNAIIMRDVAFIGFLVLAGVWAATLSSALGSLLGAPRTLQALAKDRVVPIFLGKGTGPTNNPRTATIVSFLIALAGLNMGKIDAIAPVLTMFSLTAYGFLNLIAGLEQLIGNPSWRPKFRVPAIVSLFGAAACFATMFMINAGATFVAGFFCLVLFYVTRVRNLNARWGDMRRAVLTSMARYSINRLAELKKSAKSWRPHILVLSGSPNTRWYLVELADAFTHGQGFLTIAAILPKKSLTDQRCAQFEGSMKDFLKKKGITAIAKTVVADDLFTGAQALVRSYGLGPLVPNTFLLGETEKEAHYSRFSELIQLIYNSKRNVIIIREGNHGAPLAPRKKKRIDVWWGGEHNNASLSLALAYMLQNSREWRRSPLMLKMMVDREEEVEKAKQRLIHFILEGRIDAEPQVYVRQPDEDRLEDAIRKYSDDANLIFIGMRAPEEFDSPEAFSKYYEQLIEKTQDFPPTAIVLANENLKFREIFQ